MKKTLVVLAALGVMAADAVQAQSSVTLYGVLDVAVGVKTENKVEELPSTSPKALRIKQFGLVSDNLGDSHWGLRLWEDIGSGMAVVGHLESGFSIDTGEDSGNGLFDRRANVGLSSGRFGTVLLGRNSSSYNDVVGDGSSLIGFFNPSGGDAPSYKGSSRPFIVMKTSAWLGHTGTLSDSIKYISPEFNGFSASLSYALDEDKRADFNAGNTISASLQYSSGALTISGGYQSEGLPSNYQDFKNPKLRNMLVSASYDFGPVLISAGYNKARLMDKARLKDENTAYETDEVFKHDEYVFGLTVPVGVTKLSLGYAQSRDGDVGTSKGWGAQIIHDLSKRTSFYAGFRSIKIFDKVLERNRSFLVDGDSLGDNNIFALGVRHSF